MTPFETFLTIEAEIWRDERAQKLALKQAWQMALLSRVKRIPPLKSLLMERKARALSGPELDQRRKEFKQMTSGLDINAINRKRAGRNG